MQINETVNEGLKREFTVRVEAAELERRVSSELDRLRAKIRMPGFRPGKVPVSLIKKLHGQAVEGQVVETTIQETTRRLIDDKALRPATQPNIEITAFESGADLEYKVALEVLPQIESPDLSDLVLERLVAEVGDDAVEEMLTRLAAQQKRFVAAPKSHKAKAGDAVLIDFVGKVDGKPFDGGTAEGFQLELGSGRFIPGFEAQLEGAKAGDAVTVNVGFPKDYGSKALAGKDAVFDVTVKEVQVAEEAKIDDDLAKNLGLEDLAALKDLLRQQIEREQAQMSRAHLKRQLLDALAARHDFAVPETMVEAEFDQIWRTLLEQSSEDERKALEEDEAEKADYRAIAERRVRLGLLLAQVGQDNKVEVRQEEVNRLIAEEAQRFPGQEKQVFEFYRKNAGAMAQLRAPLYEDKVVDFILELAKITERTVDRATLEAALNADEVGAGTKAEEEQPAAGKKAGAKAKAKAKAGAEDGEAVAAKPQKTKAVKNKAKD
ncbi:MAG: trigger factor [Alphaproteobacteria bacterium]|nr:MAG: trigger factor [Alphaproteobacteria bacterium]